MIISRKCKFIYALAPRTASTATADYLKKEFYGEEVLEKDLLDEDGNIVVDKKHATFVEIKHANLIDESDFDKFYKFFTVRNPFDSLYSAWFKMKKTYVPLLMDESSWIYRKPKFLEEMNFIKSHDFSSWIEVYYVHMLNEKPKHLYHKYTHLSDGVIRFENLDEDLAKLLKDLGVDAKVEVPMLNKTVGRETGYQQAYTDKARSIVETVYAPDLVNYGYTF